MTYVTLWPPLDEIRRVLQVVPDRPDDTEAGAPSAGAAPDPGTACAPVDGDLPDTLRLLVERRAAAAALPTAERWTSGDIVAVPAGKGVTVGVLLDEPDGSATAPQGTVWRGWLTCAEVDWAGAHDLVLEPQDEPFDPAVGVVQAWHPVWVQEVSAPRLGRLTAARLAAVRAVHAEFLGGASDPGAVADAQPGWIGLRTVGGFTVLTGTSLSEGDPRIEYRAAYRAVGERLTVARPARKAAPTMAVEPPGHRIRRWLKSALAGGAPSRIALAGACAVVLGLTVQGLYDTPPVSRAGGDDDVRFRSIPAPQARAELSVRWRDAADAGDIAVLLHSFGGEIVGGPNAAGRWQVRVPDAAVAQRAMLASPLVAEVVSP